VAVGTDGTNIGIHKHLKTVTFEGTIGMDSEWREEGWKENVQRKIPDLPFTGPNIRRCIVGNEGPKLRNQILTDFHGSKEKRVILH